MLSLSRRSWLLATPVLALLLTGRAAAESEEVTFDTADGVKIKGTYWPSTKGGKAPTVLLLHNFDAAKGGDSHQDGWDSLGDALQKKGFAVLSFDFRGFGKSTTVNPQIFFNRDNLQQNRFAVKGNALANPAKLPVAISHKDFQSGYFPYMLGDIAAAKAFLDRQCDKDKLNSSNLVVIGAGDGALLGNAWVASEMHRKKATPQAGIGGGWNIDTASEGQDIAVCIWLSVSTHLGGQQRGGTLANLQKEIGKAQNPVQMVFIYGQEEKDAADLAAQGLKNAVPNYNPAAKPEGYKYSGEKDIAKTKLSGSKLLDPQLPTENWIVNEYLGKYFENQGVKQAREHDFKNTSYVYVFGTSVVPSKVQNDETLRVPPTTVQFLFR